VWRSLEGVFPVGSCAVLIGRRLAQFVANQRRGLPGGREVAVFDLIKNCLPSVMAPAALPS
jgi:hypothetical protein